MVTISIKNPYFYYFHAKRIKWTPLCPVYEMKCILLFKWEIFITFSSKWISGVSGNKGI